MRLRLASSLVLLATAAVAAGAKAPNVLDAFLAVPADALVFKNDDALVLPAPERTKAVKVKDLKNGFLTFDAFSADAPEKDDEGFTLNTFHEAALWKNKANGALILGVSLLRCEQEPCGDETCD